MFLMGLSRFRLACDMYTGKATGQANDLNIANVINANDEVFAVAA